MGGSMGEAMAALILGYGLDLLFGDPHSLYHPVRAIGAVINGTERLLRRWCTPGGTSIPKRELAAGGVLAAVVIAVSVSVPGILLWIAGRISPWLRFGLMTLFCYQLLAAKSLADESRKVEKALKAGDVEGARKAVSMIVGRDTKRLDPAGIARAAVETVAENTSDGVIAPLLFMALFGPLGGFFYKAVNTMDSMVGYRNERYFCFGRAAARLDDACNLIPARLTALLMVLAAFLLGYDGKGAWRIWRRDRSCHASPNSAHGEAACAGALGLRLAGDAWYFGVLHKKPYIGDERRPIQAEDISRACRLMITAEAMAMVLAAVFSFLGTWFLG